MVVDELSMERARVVDERVEITADDKLGEVADAVGDPIVSRACGEDNREALQAGVGIDPGQNR